jgi:hypothetical protein
MKTNLGHRYYLTFKKSGLIFLYLVKKSKSLQIYLFSQMTLVYNDILTKKKQVEKLSLQGKHKYDYDSDEETEVSTLHCRLNREQKVQKFRKNSKYGKCPNKTKYIKLKVPKCKKKIHNILVISCSMQHPTKISKASLPNFGLFDGDSTHCDS